MSPCTMRDLLPNVATIFMSVKRGCALYISCVLCPYCLRSFFYHWPLLSTDDIFHFWPSWANSVFSISLLCSVLHIILLVCCIHPSWTTLPWKIMPLLCALQCIALAQRTFEIIKCNQPTLWVVLLARESFYWICHSTPTSTLWIFCAGRCCHRHYWIPHPHLMLQ